jgi:hypothetical protein
MSFRQPLACTLTPVALRERKALIYDLLRRALVDTAPVPGGVRARFRGGDEIELQLRELIELEAQCCSFFNMIVEPGQEATVLEVTGPSEAQELIEELFAGATARLSGPSC